MAWSVELTLCLNPRSDAAVGLVEVALPRPKGSHGLHRVGLGRPEHHAHRVVADAILVLSLDVGLKRKGVV